MKTPKLMIVGAGGQASVAIDTLVALGEFHSVECITDANPDLHGESHLGIPILGGEEKWRELYQSGIHMAFIAIGNNPQRAKVANRLKEIGFRFQTIIHPQSIVSPRSQIGEGTIVMAGAVIQIGATIGNHCIVNTSASIDHDCQIDDFAHIAPGTHLGGTVHVGEGALVGIGTSVIPNRTIGQWSVVGAGSVVVIDIPNQKVAFGNPAKEIKDL